jgi:hypothetical protein
MKKLAAGSIDAIICVDREYGRMSEQDWHAMMREIVAQARRVLKPKGSAVFILEGRCGTNTEWKGGYLWESILTFSGAILLAIPRWAVRVANSGMPR